jgi:hypothetical protein
MKIILACLFILTGCATKADKRPVVESKKIKPLTYEQKDQRISKVLTKHPEFTKEVRAKVKTLLSNAFDKAEKLRIRESQLVQQLGRYTLVKQGTSTQIKKLKMELKKVYNKKYDNVSMTIDKLKKIVGIKSVNENLMKSFQADHILEFR